MSPPRLSLASLAALFLGLAALPFFFVAGIPAVVVGVQALRRINASDGALFGRGLALAGIVLGLFGCLFSVVGGVALGIVHLQERAGRAGCIEHLRQVGLATNKYASEFDMYPLAGTPAPGLAPEKRTSWHAAILPYLGPVAGEEWVPGPASKELSDKVWPRRAWDDPANAEPLSTSVPSFVCPAQRAARRRPVTTYVGLAGIDPRAAFRAPDDPKAGIFNFARPLGRDGLPAGTTFTMLAVETALDLGPWLAAGPSTVRGVAPAEDDYFGAGRPFGGLHRGGAYVVWADGSVRWLADTVPPADFRAQATVAGKRP